MLLALGSPRANIKDLLDISITLGKHMSLSPFEINFMDYSNVKYLYDRLGMILKESK